LKVAIIIVYANLDPTAYAGFQALSGLIITVIIALEFKRSLLVIAERKQHIVQARTTVWQRSCVSIGTSTRWTSSEA
jgi:hypothetical protein